MNHLHLYHLVEAERHRLRRELKVATKLYERAIEGAKTTQFVNDQALACELAGKCCIDQGQMPLAREFLIDARHAYARWGAKAKVTLLNEQLKTQPVINIQPTSRYTTITHSTTATMTGLSASESPEPPPSTMLQRLTSTFSSGSAELGTLARMFDMGSVIKGAQSLSGIIELPTLLEQLMKIVVENAGAERGALILQDGAALRVEARISTSSTDAIQIDSLPLDQVDDLPIGMIRYVARTRESMISADVVELESFLGDGYLMRFAPKSLACIPILRKNDLIGVLYLEHGSTNGAFTIARVEVLQVLAAQAAISIENARLYGSLREALARAQESDRLKSEFLNNVSHELRTPLNAIINIPEGMKEWITRKPIVRCGNCGTLFDLDLDQQTKTEKVCPECAVSDALRMEVHAQFNGDALETFEFLDRICLAGRNLEQVVEEMLDMSQLQSGSFSLKLEEVTVTSLLGSIKNHVHQERLGLVKGIIIELPEVPSGLVLQGDRDKLEKVFEHLVNNAIKVSPVDGLVKVGVEAIEDAIVFSVRDQGCGVNKDKQAIIFDSFRQADGGTTRALGGVGLGLTITRRLVELHGGQIWIESEAGQGSCFFVKIPLMVRLDSGMDERNHA